MHKSRYVVMNQMVDGKSEMPIAMSPQFSQAKHRHFVQQ